MNSNSTNQHDLVLLQARVDARRAEREEAREAVFSDETIAAAQALAAQFERDDLAQRVYDRIAELKVLVDLSRKETLRLKSELNALGNLVFPPSPI